MEFVLPSEGKLCPVCRMNATFIKLGQHSQISSENNSLDYTLFQCERCAVQFWWPMKNPGAEWYSHDDRYSFRNSDPIVTPVNSHRLFLKNCPFLKGSILDVGCGTGNFLLAAKKKGYFVRGIDFDPDAVRVARNIFGLDNVNTSSLDELIHEGATFDAVTFFEVLEHMDDLNLFMREIRKLVRPDGFIGLSVPYRGSWDVFKLGDTPPRHFTRWDKKSIKIFLISQGFEIISVHPFWVSLDFLITKFHFWTKGYLSFGLVNRVRKASSIKDTEKDTKLEAIKTRKLVRILKILAKIKDYFLFFIPSIFLYLYLILIGRQRLGMYVLARKGRGVN